jgi:hypothetical protein
MALLRLANWLQELKELKELQEFGIVRSPLRLLHYCLSHPSRPRFTCCMVPPLRSLLPSSGFPFLLASGAFGRPPSELSPASRVSSRLQTFPLPPDLTATSPWEGRSQMPARSQLPGARCRARARCWAEAHATWESSRGVGVIGVEGVWLAQEHATWESSRVAGVEGVG